jgi:hypothetical protein
VEQVQVDTEVHRGWEDFDCVRRLLGLWADNKLGIHLDLKSITVKIKVFPNVSEEPSVSIFRADNEDNRFL